MPKLDMDCSAVCFGNTGSLVDAAFYNQLSSCGGAIMHSGDCKDGRNEGMDETVTINFDKLSGVSAILFLISAFEGGTLKDCESTFCEIKQGSKVLYTLLPALFSLTTASTALAPCNLTPSAPFRCLLISIL
jgi:stress response protein SCP2